MKNVALLVKLHPRDEPVGYWRSLLKNGIGKSLIDIVNGPRLSECLDRSDAVLVNASTTCLEAMMRGRPVITVNYLPTTWYLDYARFGAVLSVDRPSGLEGAIRTALFEEETRSRLVQNAEAVLREELFLLDGKSAERIADLLEKVARGE
jgi:glycosyltransferase involved in cell wall biosynthesis